MAKNKNFNVSEGLFSDAPQNEVSISKTETEYRPATNKSSKSGKAGRPASATEPVNQIGFRITPKQHTVIKMYALKNNMDQSAALRKIIDESEILKNILENL